MKLITSKNNPVYREIRQLAMSAQMRRKTAKTLLDGIHLCQSYLSVIGNPLFCVVNEKSKTVPEIADILAACKKRRVSCLELTAVLYDGISQVDNGAGILFVIEPPIYSLPEKIENSVVLLDRIQDPGNLGSILRSASAAGVSDVFCSRHTALAWSPRVLRAAMGAHFLIRIHENVDLMAWIDQTDMPVIATVLDAQKTLYDIDLRKPVAWIFGHEGQGIAKELRSKVDIELTVPHAGQQESLNVAACAAVCFFEQLRQKRQGTLS